MSEKVVETCRKRNRMLIDSFEDIVINRYLYKRLLAAAAESGIKIDPGTISSVKNVSELRNAVMNAILTYYENNPDLLSPETFLNAVKDDLITQKIVSFIAGMLSVSGHLTYEDALTIARECHMSRTYALLRRYPKVSNVVISFLNALASSMRREEI